MIQVWVDGKFIGQDELDVGRSFPETTDSVKFSLGDLKPGEHVISVMVRNNSHNWNLMADDYHREARGLICGLADHRAAASVSPCRSPGASRATRAARTIADIVRGPMNNGGLYGERAGWHLPRRRQDGWQAAKPTRRAARAQAPTGCARVQAGPAARVTTCSWGWRLATPRKPRSERENRALIFVNGWNMGQFIAHIGPQRSFVIPPGILNPNGENTIALAVTTDGKTDNALEPVKLVKLRTCARRRAAGDHGRRSPMIDQSRRRHLAGCRRRCSRQRRRRERRADACTMTARPLPGPRRCRSGTAGSAPWFSAAPRTSCSS